MSFPFFYFIICIKALHSSQSAMSVSGSRDLHLLSFSFLFQSFLKLNPQNKERERESWEQQHDVALSLSWAQRLNMTHDPGR